jgi:hypothetical protein
VKFAAKFGRLTKFTSCVIQNDKAHGVPLISNFFGYIPSKLTVLGFTQYWTIYPVLGLQATYRRIEVFSLSVVFY